jgi:hypothetical protein
MLMSFNDRRDIQTTFTGKALIEKIRFVVRKHRTRSRSIDGRCKFYDNCQWARKDGATCLCEDEASSGYCGKYRVNEVKEKYR